ncbi:MAG: winged helix DNA-binding domain-containing protein [Chloroflexi bacterium]|nr:winged helix DNA-binding domain-containing protein [Chloroflexota bacterium]
MGRRLELTRPQILTFRRGAQGLEERRPASAESLEQAAWAGLQDSMPRAAVLSIHARVEGTRPVAWEDPTFVQLWGPRYSAYVVARRDIAVFTLGRLPDDPAKRAFAHRQAERLDGYLNGRTMLLGEAGHGLGVHPNSLRYAAPTGTVLIRWDGARQPTIWTLPAPDMDPTEARLELARRYLHVFGPTTASAFATWAGVTPTSGRRVFESLAEGLIPVQTPIGEGWALAGDEPAFRAPAGATAPARLLPSGDTYFLLQGADREFLVQEPRLRSELWTSRVWPGAVLVGGEVVGTWRRAGAELTVQSWRRLSADERRAVEAEAAALPLPDLRTHVRVRWG